LVPEELLDELPPGPEEEELLLDPPPLLLQAATTMTVDAASAPHLIPREMRKTDSFRV